MKMKLEWAIAALIVLCLAYAVVLRKYQKRLDVDERVIQQLERPK